MNFDKEKITYKVYVDPDIVNDFSFKEKINDTLNDPKSWIKFYDIQFIEVPYDNDATLTIKLLKKKDTETYCGMEGLSCFNLLSNVIVINYSNWETAPKAFKNSKNCKTHICSDNDYRTYVINHEVGHFLGKGHLNAEDFDGKLAPVMIQQTLGIGNCYPNFWPTEYDYKIKNYM